MRNNGANVGIYWEHQMKPFRQMLVAASTAVAATFFSPIALAQYYPLLSENWEFNDCRVPVELSF